MSSSAISLAAVYPISQPQQYKLHLACWNGTSQPLDVFVRDRAEWEGWNTYRGTRNDFSRAFIFALMDFYPQRDRWLFGGAYRVVSRDAQRQEHSYSVELLEESRPLIGRLKIAFSRPARGRAFCLERYYQQMEVAELLPEAYTGTVFPGHDAINISFAALQSLVAEQRADWKAALENVKGVYLITDTDTGRRYVGSAYGDTGIWARWSAYTATGHGHNVELRLLLAPHGLDYAQRFFHFALLEHRTMNTNDQVILAREAYWKDVLLTRGSFGLNRN